MRIRSTTLYGSLTQSSSNHELVDSLEGGLVISQGHRYVYPVHPILLLGRSVLDSLREDIPTKRSLHFIPSFLPIIIAKVLEQM